MLFPEVLDSRIDSTNKSTNHESENWYISSTEPRSTTAWYNTAALKRMNVNTRYIRKENYRWATGAYRMRTSSKVFCVVSASPSFNEISADVFLLAASVSINTSSSSKLPSDWYLHKSSFSITSTSLAIQHQ